MAILSRIYPIALAAVLTGCYESFTPDIDTTPVLCLNSLITAGVPIEYSVTRTWLYTDANGSTDHGVNDAEITLHVNGKPESISYIPQEGDQIHIVAESPTYGKAEAEVTVPVCTPIESLEWEADVTDKWEWVDPEAPEDTYVTTYLINLKARMTIADPAATENYYHFAHNIFSTDEGSQPGVTVLSPVSVYSGTFRYEAEPIFSEHIGILDAISGSDAYGFTFFTDRQFSEKSYTLNLKFEGMRCDVRSEGLTDDMLECGMIFTLNTVSQSYYNWSNYQWQIDNGTIGDLGDIGLGDPVQGYSNVSTGAGVVAAQAGTRYTVNLKDFLKKEITTGRIA